MFLLVADPPLVEVKHARRIAIYALMARQVQL